MLSVDDVLGTRNGKAYDNDGDKIGSIGQVYLDDKTGQPAWVTVNTGLFGTSESFVPLDGARVEGEDLHLPYSKAKIKDAPRQDADSHLDLEQEDALYRYYGLGDGDAAVAGTAGYAADGDRDRDGHTFDDKARDIVDNEDGRRDGRDNAAFAGDRNLDGERDRLAAERRDNDADGVVLHEERLNVAKEQREVGKARLRKYVVTEQQQVDVPVTREEVQVTREPLNERVDGNYTLGEETQSVTLHEERPVVEKETVATERVGLDVNQVTETQRVQAEVGREEVRVESDVDGVRDADNR